MHKNIGSKTWLPQFIPELMKKRHKRSRKRKNIFHAFYLPIKIFFNFLSHVHLTMAIKCILNTVPYFSIYINPSFSWTRISKFWQFTDEICNFSFVVQDTLTFSTKCVTLKAIFISNHASKSLHTQLNNRK